MALVQEWATLSDTTGFVSRDATGSATTAGNFLHLSVTIFDDTDTVSVSDGASNTWQQVPSFGEVDTACIVRHFYAISAASVTTVTLTRGTGGTALQACLREFDDPIGALIQHNGAANASSTTPPPCEVTFTDTGAVVVGSIVLPVTSRALTLQNTTEFTALAPFEAGGMETLHAYGILSNGTYGPDWDITTGSAMVTGAVTSAFAGSVRPVASAGADLQVPVGSTGVQLAGTPSDGGGAGAPYTHAWRIISDTTGGAVLSSTTVEDPTVDMGPSAGVVTLGYKVTDTGAVESLEDTMTVTAIGASNTSVPISDAVVTGWTTEPSGAPTVASVVADFNLGTYAAYVDPAGTVIHEFDLSDWPAELSTSDTITVRYRPAHLGFSSVSAVLSIKEGASTTIATFPANVWTAEELPQSFAHTLSPTQIGAITDPTNLRARVEYTGTV